MDNDVFFYFKEIYLRGYGSQEFKFKMGGISLICL